MVQESITIATLTYKESFVDIKGFLIELKTAITRYPGSCEVIVVNNSGEQAAADTELEINSSGIREICPTRVYSSPKNNIASGRNLALCQANNDLVVFLDDDSFPVPCWLIHLVETANEFDADMVTGPTIPLYLFDTPDWVKSVDLHNSKGKTTGQDIEKSGSGNLMLRRSKMTAKRFDEAYGITGGEDSEFLLRQTQSGFKLVWCNEAAVYEYIPKNRSSGIYLIKRFIYQGQLHRKISIETGSMKNLPLFVLKSVLMIVASTVITPILVLVSSPKAAVWIKRGFGNLGHVTTSATKLYPTTDQSNDK